MFRNSPNSYGSVSKFLHWIILLLLIFMILSGYFTEDLNPAIQGTLMNLHKLTGLSILTLMCIRVLWRFTNPTPIYPPRMTRFNRILAQSVHVLLYLAVIAMPLSGWIMSTAFAHPPHIGSWIIYLPGIQTSHALGESFEDIHSTLAVIILVLVGLHILGALKHYFIDKDGILQRMLPRCCKPKNQ